MENTPDHDRAYLARAASNPAYELKKSIWANGTPASMTAKKRKTGDAGASCSDISGLARMQKRNQLVFEKQKIWSAKTSDHAYDPKSYIGKSDR